MLYTSKVAIRSEIRTKYLTQSEHHVEFLMLNVVVFKESAMVWKVKPPKMHSVIYMWIVKTVSTI
jgi:hypothetical protein